MKSIALISLLASAATAAFAQSAPSPLTSLSARGQIGSGAGSIIAGFVINGTAPKQILIRGTGPGLAAFGDANAAALVTVNIYDSTGALVATDDGSSPDPLAAQAGDSVGAFPQTAAGDSALLASLPPGAYSIEVAPNTVDSPTGDALLEIYDVDAPGSGSTLANLAVRGQVGATAGTMISGFVVDGTANKNILVRGVGADLAAFGVANAAPVVGVAIYDANGNLVASNSGMQTDPNAAGTAQTAAALGAFALSSSGDSALVVNLPPGAYTVELTPGAADAANAVALLEVYDADAAMAATGN